MSRRALIAVILRATPARWRETIAGDLEEEFAGRRVPALHAARVVARLWIEEIAIARQTPRRRPAMGSLGQTVRQAARALVTRPGYSLIVIATLAIGIGANASVFTLANWLLLRPLPAVEAPERLVTMRFAAGFGHMTISHIEMETVAAHMPALDRITGSMESFFSLAAGAAPAERVEGAIVSADYFEVLGVRPAFGRAFSPAEPGVVISHGYWQSRLGGLPGAVGSKALINGNPQPILGIAPRGFTGTSRSSAVEVWVPTTLRSGLFPSSRPDPLGDIRAGIYIELFARLKPGASIDEARASVEGAKTALAAIHPAPARYKRMTLETEAGISEQAYQRTRLGGLFALLMAMVALLLVLTCANVGNVVLANGTARRAELATRQALGASRGRIVAGVIVECVLLSLFGGAAAVAIAWAMGALMRGTVVLPYLAALGGVSIDWRVLAFAFGVSTAAAVGAGLLPALAATRFDLLSALKGTSRSVTGGGQRLRRTLLVAQVAVSLTLLVGGLLLAQSVRARRNVDPGFDTSRLMTFSLEAWMHRWEGERLAAFYGRLMTEVHALPGVERAALGWGQPFGNRVDDGAVRALNGISPTELELESYRVNEGYFATMGIPIVAGRGFTAADLPEDFEAALRPVIVSQSAAERLFGSPAAAVGQTLVADYPHDARRVIVGVAGDARLRKAFEPPAPAIYARLGNDSPFATVHLRLAPGVQAAAVAPLVRQAVRAVDPTLPPYDVMTVRDAMSRQMTEDVLIGRLTMAFALIATLLAAVGLYGVLAQSVSERRIEIGIRAALGAAPGRVIGWIAAGALRMTAIGAVIGVALSLWLGRYIETRLFGVDRFDAATFAFALGVMVVTSLVATIVPASRAARVDPVTALRQ